MSPGDIWTLYQVKFNSRTDYWFYRGGLPQEGFSIHKITSLIKTNKGYIVRIFMESFGHDLTDIHSSFRAMFIQLMRYN